MKKKFVVLLIAFLCVLSCIVVMANMNSMDGMHTSLLSEIFDKVTPFSVGKVVRDITDNQEIVKAYGDISVTKGELELAKLILVNRDDGDTSTEAALDLALKKKLLIKDAEKRGLEVKQDQLQKALTEAKENSGITADGIVTKNDDVRKILEENGLSYSDYEKVKALQLQYSLLYYDYAKLVYEELKETQEDVVFGDAMVDAYLDTLLAELKTNS